MDIPKMTEQDRARFLAVVPDRPDVVVKPMFGNLGAYVNGNMFMGSFGPDIGVKLPDADREELLGHECAGPFGPDERPMGGYVTLPSTWPTTDSAEHWILRSLDYVSAFPAKVAKARKPKS